MDTPPTNNAEEMVTMIGHALDVIGSNGSNQGVPDVEMREALKEKGIPNNVSGMMVPMLQAMGLVKSALIYSLTDKGMKAVAEGQKNKALGVKLMDKPVKSFPVADTFRHRDRYVGPAPGQAPIIISAPKISGPIDPRNPQG